MLVGSDLVSSSIPSKIFLLLLYLVLMTSTDGSEFTINEATIIDIQSAFRDKKLTSRELVEHYLTKIGTHNPQLRGVLEVNPAAREQAEAADRERLEATAKGRPLGDLHGVPVLLKDSIATADRLNTTAGSYALLGSRVAREASVVERLRRNGAIILGKATMNEWYKVRSRKIPNGWSARGGLGVNPYAKWWNPCGSSSGSAIAVAANLVAVSLGTETRSSILCPAEHNSAVGLKPTVGLTSRAGVIPLSPRQDSVGPICRTVTDAVLVLDAIVGFDPRDYEATKAGSKFIPAGGYKQFLKEDGIQGKRLGVVRAPFFDSYKGTAAIGVFEHHLEVLRRGGATVVDNLEIVNIDVILDSAQSGELDATMAEFKLAINDYLKNLLYSSVKSLSDVIAFNSKNPELEKLKEYGQDGFLQAEKTSGIGERERRAIMKMESLSREGFEKLMKENELDAMVTLGPGAAPVMAIGGYPAITVPAGFKRNGVPFGICFGGLKGTEQKLIEIAYAFEQATKARVPPPLYN